MKMPVSPTSVFTRAKTVPKIQCIFFFNGDLFKHIENGFVSSDFSRMRILLKYQMKYH